MEISHSNEKDPFETRQWTEFLQTEAEKRGITYTQLVEYITQLRPEEFNVIKEIFLKQYNNGRLL